MYIARKLIACLENFLICVLIDIFLVADDDGHPEEAGFG